MLRSLRAQLALIATAFALLALPAANADSKPHIHAARTPQLLIQTKVSQGAYYHESIPTAVDVITRLGNGQLSLNESVADNSVAQGRTKWNVTHISDDRPMEDAKYLSQFDVVAFVSTNDRSPPDSGSILSDAAAANFAKYIQNGGGFVGIHSASACLFTRPFFGRLVGAFFDYHPEIQPVGIRALSQDHPSTSKFPAVFNITEEVYHYRTDPRALPEPANVLLSNATAFNDPQAASRTRSDGPAPRPLAWWREGRLLDEPRQPLGEGMDSNGTGPGHEGGGPGRMWYTSLGHLNETWQNPYFQGHVAGGIGWVLQSKTSKPSSSGDTISSSSGAQDSEMSNIAAVTVPSGHVTVAAIAMSAGALALLFLQ